MARLRRVAVLIGGSAALVLLGVAIGLLLGGIARPSLEQSLAPPVPSPRSPARLKIPRPTAPVAAAMAAPAPVTQPVPSLTVEQMLVRASAFEQQRRHREAHALFVAALEREPASGAALLGAARTGVELRSPGALEALSRSPLPEHRRALRLLRVRQAMLAGEWAQAQALLRQLPRPQRHQLRPELWLAEILAARGRSQRSAGTYRWLLRDHRLKPGPLFAEVAIGYARLLVDQGLHEQARRHARRALRAAAGVPSLETEARELIARLR